MSLSDPKQLLKVSSVALGSLAVFLGIIYLFGFGVVHLLNSVQSEIGKTLIAASVTVFVAVITLVLGKLLEQRLKIRDEVRAKKIPVYEKHMATFFDILFSKQQKKEHADAFKAFAEHAITWASSDVIKAWNGFRSMDADNCTADQRLDRLEHLFRAIRRDSGNPVWNLKKRALLDLFLNKEPKNHPSGAAAQSPR